MTDEQVIIGMAVCLLLFITLFLLQSLMLYIKSIRYKKLQEENKLLMQFFEEQRCMDAEYLDACRAMIYETVCANSPTRRKSNNH